MNSTIVDGTAVTEDHGEWDFLAILHLGDKAAEIDDGVVYDLIGRAFTDGSHFIAYFQDKETLGIFHYNGMQHNRFSQHIPKGKTKTHLAASGSEIPLPVGYQTYLVIYHLCGGARA